MRFRRMMAWAVVIGLLPASGWAQTPLDQIRRSETASEAVAVYARAVSADADPTLAQQAFITRMVELESPELAAEQAKDVTLYVNDGQAWAVLAYVDAQNNEIELALEKIVKAVKYSPSDDFVQKTAGEIVAWYELREDRDALPENMHAMAEQVTDSSAARGRSYAKAHETATRILTDGLPEDEYGMPVQVVGSLEDLGTYSGYTTRSVPGLVSFWNSPYLYPGYSLEPWWVDYNRPGHWAFPPVLLRNVSRDVRYLRLPFNQGFILVDDLGAVVVPNRAGYWRRPYYSWQRDPWHFGYAVGYPRHSSSVIRFPGRVWAPGGFTPRRLVWGPGIGADYYRANRIIGYPGGNTRISQRLGQFRPNTSRLDRGPGISRFSSGRGGGRGRLGR